MIRIALLVLVLAGCSNKKPEERKLPGSAAPTTTSTPPPATGSAVGSATGSAAPSAPEPPPPSFAPFDDALAGKQPWVAPDDKAGVIELNAVEDLSGRTKGKFSVERRCGADAAKVAEAVGKQLTERVKTNHEAPVCKTEGDRTACFQRGLAEGDVDLEIEYARAGDKWRVIGVKTYGRGMTITKQEEQYAELLKDKCK
jgi:hypothetical protein